MFQAHGGASETHPGLIGRAFFAVSEGAGGPLSHPAGQDTGLTSTQVSAEVSTAWRKAQPSWLHSFRRSSQRVSALTPGPHESSQHTRGKGLGSAQTHDHSSLDAAARASAPLIAASRWVPKETPQRGSQSSLVGGTGKQR